MKVGLIAPINNQQEKKFVDDLLKKIKAIGFKSDLMQVDTLADYDILVVVFDGHRLLPADYIKLGVFHGHKIGIKTVKLIIGYQTANNDYLQEEDKYLDHLAKTELNLISCLKDYIYYHQHG